MSQVMSSPGLINREPVYMAGAQTAQQGYTPLKPGSGLLCPYISKALIMSHSDGERGQGEGCKEDLIS